MIYFPPCAVINVIAVCDTVLTYFIYLYLTAVPVTNIYNIYNIILIFLCEYEINCKAYHYKRDESFSPMQPIGCSLLIGTVWEKPRTVLLWRATHNEDS